MKKNLLFISSVFILCSLKVNVQAQCDRASIVNDYNNVYLPAHVSNTDLGWTGNVSTCVAGSVSSLAHTRTLARINYFRELVGLPGNITLDPVLNAKCQEAALMFVANNQLSHFPPNTWTCYTTDGDDAAQKSNIYMGWGGGTYHSATAVTDWIDDAGSGNTECGHRRWILYSKANQFGHGSTSSSSALWVINTPTTAAPINYIAWPSEGFFPAPLLPTSNRWSFGIPNADFSNATVQMTGPGGTPVSVTLETLANGYGDNTLVWLATGIIANNAQDQHYTVNVNNVTVNGSSQNFTYVVKIAQPVHPPQCPSGTTWSDNACACSLSTGIDAEENDNTVLSVFPNPAANYLELTLATEASVNAVVDIMDIQGKRVMSVKADTKSVNLDVSGLSNGMYFITVQNNNKLYKDKFVISK